MELVINESSKIAIYNSLPFHYEMYGFILNYAKNTNRLVDIYSVKDHNIGWFDFYTEKFNNFFVKQIDEYTPYNNYDYIFLTTDTDRDFKPDWFNERVVVINHDYKIRNMYSLNYINVAKFKDSMLDYCIPCYPLCNTNEKTNNNVISIIGGHEIVIYNTKYNTDVINRIHFNNNNPVELHFISRSISTDKLKSLDPRFIVYIHENISTLEMEAILKKSTYILLSFCDSQNKREAHLASGSIQLAYNYLCRPIINGYTNKHLKLKYAVEYDENSNDNIMLCNVDFNQLLEARTRYINYLPVALENLKKNLTIPKTIIQTWETKHFSKEFQQITNSWKIYNPNYEYILFDKNEREEFIETYFDKEILEAYKNIIPGAYKSDLFRYCYLYVKGGIYADIDTLCLGNIDKLLIPNINLIAAIDLNLNEIDGKHNIFNGFICARPKNRIFLSCITRIVQNVKNGFIPQSKLAFTGPGLFGEIINIYLGNKPTESFVEQEGIINDIMLLRFNPITEYISDIYGNIYLQNKNGNNMIIQLYNLECKKINDFVCWVTSDKIIRDNAVVRNLTNKHIALMMCGQFRSYKNNLRNNLIALRPILDNNYIHIFILTDKAPDGNYSLENEREVLGIFQEFGYKIEFIEYIENHDLSEEKLYCDTFFKTIKHNTGIGNSFVPNFMYRKYLLNKLCNDYIEKNNIPIDLYFYARIFDMNIFYNNNTIIQNSFQKIQNTVASLLDNPNNIIFSGDTLFLCHKNALTDIFYPWNKDLTIKLYHDDIWDDPFVSRQLYDKDSVLITLKHTYAPEVQYLFRMYYSNYSLQCIRIDHNNPVNINDTMLYNIIHDPDRFSFPTYGLNLLLSNEKVIEICSSINDKIVIDNNAYMEILTSISYYLHNCLVVNIGTFVGHEIVMLSRFHSSNVKKAIIYSFDIQHNLPTEINHYLNNRPLKIFNENIYMNEVLVKYTTCLLSSKIICINVYDHNYMYINNLLQFLFNFSYSGLIIIKNNTVNFTSIHHEFLKYRILLDIVLDHSLYFMKFS